ncbi:MAG TPA: winged helix DNA-binding domain-containing protein [Bacteroidia bacterium]|nr:winged helix DNA-binding domain-containing protein [Bacteroidia bacterium]
MKLSDIANIRLQTQQLATTPFKKPQDIVEWMGAIQAQDYAMAKWGLGIRLPGITDIEIEAAINSGKIIRTHIMRPTWHLVSAKDIYWMTELSAPHLISSMRGRQKELGLTEAIFSKCNKVIGKALEGGKHLTREELMATLKKAKIDINQHTAIHIMYMAEIYGVVCNGPIKGKKQTYALLEERIPRTKKLTRDEALVKLAKKYFNSHGPATIQDFMWWSGLPAKDARSGLEIIKSGFISETIGSETYWFSSSIGSKKSTKPSIHLLPAFDEFIISYKDRTAAIQLEHQKKAFTSNGIFRPVIVFNGLASGLWKRTEKTNKVVIETSFFRPHNKAEKSLLEEAAHSFGDYLNKKVELKHK